MAKTQDDQLQEPRKPRKRAGGRKTGDQMLRRVQFAFEQLQAGRSRLQTVEGLKKEFGISDHTARADLSRAYERLSAAMQDEIPDLASRIYYKFWGLLERAEKGGKISEVRKCLRELCLMFGLQDLRQEAPKTAADQARALTPRERQEQLLEVIANNPELLRLLAERHPEALRAMVGGGDEA